VKQKGSHQKYRNKAGRTVIVPADRNVIPIGTLSSIIRQAGVSKELFFD
jgi:predicted RNA binding protein YcfA (HicA-like mRNA interferase family)